jgi:hypothetical protein
MTDPATITTQQPATRKVDRWWIFLGVPGAIHCAVLVGCPNITVPPKLSQQLFTVGVAEFVLLLPFIWSVFVLFCYRTISERVIGYLSLSVSLFWLAIAVSTAIDLERGL